MFAASVTPRDSRKAPDCDQQVLDSLMAYSCGALPRWERLPGGELVGLLGEPAHVIAAARTILRRSRCSLGIGAGKMELPASLSDAAGEALALAREARQRARSRRALAPVAVAGVGAIAAQDSEALFAILSHHWLTRTEAGWEAVAAVGGTDPSACTERKVISQQVAAQQLGISQQAFSQRLRAAGWAAEQGILPLLHRRLLAAEDERGGDGL